MTLKKNKERTSQGPKNPRKEQTNQDTKKISNVWNEGGQYGRTRTNRNKSTRMQGQRKQGKNNYSIDFNTKTKAPHRKKFKKPQKGKHEVQRKT